MKSPISAIALAVLAAIPLKAEEAPAAAKVASEALISAIKTEDFEAFRDQGDENFSKALTKEIFGKVQAQIAPRLKQGYEMTYLTELNRQGQMVTLWKLTFKDGGDDALATLAMKDGKVTGFYIQ